MTAEVNIRKGGNVCAGGLRGDTVLVRIWEFEHAHAPMEDCELTDEQLGEAAVSLRFHDLTSLDSMINGLMMARSMLDRATELPGPNWIAISTLGSSYEEEMDATAVPTRYRHRKRGEAEWRQGLAPKWTPDNLKSD